MIIDRIPAHIAALPEEEQGPALVNEIHERKLRANLWEYFAAVPAPTYDPFKETRAMLGIDPAGGGAAWFHVRGRGHGKTAAAQEWRELYGVQDARIDITADLRKEWITTEPFTVEKTFTGIDEEFFALLSGTTRKELEEEQRKRDALWNIIDDALMRNIEAPPVVSVRWPTGRITVN